MRTKGFRNTLLAVVRHCSAQLPVLRSRFGCHRSNFEWNFAFELKFGLYEWNDDGTQRRRLRDGAKVCPLLPAGQED